MAGEAIGVLATLVDGFASLLDVGVLGLVGAASGLRVAASSAETGFGESFAAIEGRASG